MMKIISAFANMAISRDVVAEREFVERAVVDIFHVGFVNESTAEHCCKNARDLLANIALKHPSVQSFVISLLEDEAVLAAAGLRVFGLVKDLPLHTWSPTERDVGLLVGWLARPLSTLQSQVAQDVLGRMNWNAGDRLISWEHHQGPFTYDIRKILGFQDPFPCHCPIHATYQYYRHVLTNPPPSPSVRTSFKYAPTPNLQLTNNLALHSALLLPLELVPENCNIPTQKCKSSTLSRRQKE